jgi:hypothetical protein
MDINNEVTHLPKQYNAELVVRAIDRLDNASINSYLDEGRENRLKRIKIVTYTKSHVMIIVGHLGQILLLRAREVR